MDYRMEIEEYGSCKLIHTFVRGTLSEAERNRIAVETVRKMRECGVSRALWDIREAELGYSLIGSHLAVVNLEALGVTRDDYIAVIYFHNRDQHEHARTAAHNRGMINIDYFTDLEAGIAWLAGRRVKD